MLTDVRDRKEMRLGSRRDCGEKMETRHTHTHTHTKQYKLLIVNNSNILSVMPQSNRQSMQIK